MAEQRILTTAEWNEECREAEAERRGPPAFCCCDHGGQPFLLNGELVVTRNAGCRVHAPQPPAYSLEPDEPGEAWARMRRKW
jgi:hypothetical protein